MENSENLIKTLELKVKSLEIENEKLESHLEANKKEIKEIKSLIQSLSKNNTANNIQSNEVDLRFKWKASNLRKKLFCELKNDSKTVKKIANEGWNCTAVGDKCLVDGKINKWKIQLNGGAPDIMFGIVPSNVDLNTNENFKMGYVTNLINFGKHNLSVYTPYLNYKAKVGDIVEIIVNLVKGELYYSVNGSEPEIFCDYINKNIEYVPFVDLRYIGSEISLFN